MLLLICIKFIQYYDEPGFIVRYFLIEYSREQNSILLHLYGFVSCLPPLLLPYCI
jgi:hypothetical protein